MRIQFEKNLANFLSTNQHIGKKEGLVCNPSALLLPYDVKISDKGRELYREKVNEQNKSVKIENGESTLDKELLSKSIVDITGLTMSNFHSQFKKLNGHVNEQDNNCSSKDLMKNCFAVYTEMYEQIKQEYASGTRELWVVDETAENGFRKITEAEELEALDAAFDFYAQVVDAYVNFGAETAKFLQRAVNKQQVMLDREWRMLKSQNEESNDVIENLYNKLKYAANMWKKEYPASANMGMELFNKIVENILLFDKND